MKTNSQSKLQVMCCRSLLLALLAILLGSSCLAQCHDDAVDITTDDHASNGVMFYLTAHRTIEATVRLQCDFVQNLTPSHPLPLSFVVNRPYNKYEVLRFTQTDKRQPWHWGNYQYHFVMGAASSLPTNDYIYSLPYPQSKHCKVSQSYFGKNSHQKDTPEQYAVDFVMPEGTPILAARGGTVIPTVTTQTAAGLQNIQRMLQLHPHKA